MLRRVLITDEIKQNTFSPKTDTIQYLGYPGSFPDDNEINDVGSTWNEGASGAGGKRKKRSNLFVCIIAIICFLFGGGLGAGLTYFFVVLKPKPTTMRAEISTEKPQYDSMLTKTREDFSSDTEYAVYLYDTACKAFQNCDVCASIDDYETTTDIKGLLSIACQGCRFTVKNGTEYYYADYSGMQGQGADKFMKYMGKEEDTLFAIRSYTDISQMSYLYTEKVLHPVVSIDEGKISVEADWSEENRVGGYPKHTDIPVFCKEQDGLYAQTEMVISTDTVVSVTIDHDEDKGFYTVVFILDVNNPETTKNTIENLRAGLNGGNYTSISKTYEIWDNGYFRSCVSLDKASNGAFDLTLDFKTYFKYNEKDCKPSSYKYFDEVKQNALNE